MKTIYSTIQHILKSNLTGSVFTILTVVLLTCGGCKDFLEIDPPHTQLVREQVFESDATAIAAVNGIYRQMTGGITGGSTGSITFLTALSADETLWFSGAGQNAVEFADNNILPTNPLLTSIWGESYSAIYQANAIIEGLDKSLNISAEVASRLKGEALFLRGFYQFHLANIFGSVPYIRETNYSSNSVVTKYERYKIYEMVIEDLLSAYTLLPSDYMKNSGERTKIIKWTAGALLSRVYLYMENWQKAREYASLVIDNKSLFSLKENLNDVFLKNSSEAIFQLLPTGTSNYTNEGNIFLRTPTYTSLRLELVNAFDRDDKRSLNWIKSITNATGTFYYPTKYKQLSTNATGSEYSMVIRLSEMFLIRAEAHTKLEELDAAISDVDMIRRRAGLKPLADVKAISKTTLLDEILHQRRLELFTEWGHRWFDLKRSGQATEILSPIKIGWTATDELFPIPEKELMLNPNLLPQNGGY